MTSVIPFIWLVPLLPALGFLVLGLAGRKMSKGLVRLVACGTIGAAFVVSLLAAVPVLTGRIDASVARDGVTVNAPGHAVEVRLWEWLPAGERQGACVTQASPGGPRVPGERFLSRLSIPLGFLLDPLSAVMILVVTGVGFLIHVYASSYMEHERGYWRFFTYLNLFVAMMLVLVLGSSFALMFVGWEGVGLCSYLLIGFYYEQSFPPRAGLKAFLVNRVGDLGFILGMLLLLLTFGTVQYSEVFPRAVGAAAYAGSGTAIAIAALLFVGAMGKSAQFPLHVWLPDAMAGPTPVSALIHAATMVTAGVYLVIRANVLFQAAPAVSSAVAIVGLVTALMAASIALVQDDLKKVLAYSTVSQLGYMFIAVGVGAYAAGLFHLVTHAFFKALLFLGAGSVSHAMAGELDMRKMGGLAKKLPQTRTVMLIATLAIAGIAPLSGFWSKDEILVGVVTSVLPPALRWVLWAGALGGALMTAFYMFRLYFRTFAGEPRWDAGVHPHESPRAMVLPLWVLAALSVFGGALGFAAWTGMPSFLHHVLEPVVLRGSLVAGRAELGASTEMALAAIALSVAILGSLVARAWYRAPSEAPARLAAAMPGARRLLRGKWWIDEVLNALVISPAIGLSRLAAGFDRKVVDLAVESTGLAALLSGEALRGFTSGKVRTYALGVLAGAVGLVVWLLAR